MCSSDLGRPTQVESSLSRPDLRIDGLICVSCRDEAAQCGGAEDQQADADSDSRLPAVLCPRVAHSSGDPCCWSGGRASFVGGGAASAGGVSERCAHEENKGRTAGKETERSR